MSIFKMSSFTQSSHVYMIASIIITVDCPSLLLLMSMSKLKTCLASEVVSMCLNLELTSVKGFLYKSGVYL